MRIALLSSVVVVSFVFAGCPGPVAEGEGEGEGDTAEGEGDVAEGEGEPTSGPILSEVSCQGGDWVEVLNLDAAAIDLSAFAVTDDVNANPPRREPLTGTLAAGGRVAVDVAAFGIACDDTISLVEGGRVQDATTLGVVVEGATWARLPEPIDGSSAFAEAFPTRGLANQGLTPSTTIRINEVDCRGTERIELINVGGAIDVGGFVVAVDPTDPAGRFTLPAQTVPANGIFVVTETDGITPGFDFSIACDNGAVVLLDDNGAVLDAVTTQETPESLGWGRLPDGNGSFTTVEKTIGEPNLAPLVLGNGVFNPARLADVSLDFSGNPQTQQDCTFTFDADAPLACTVVEDGADRLRVSFTAPDRFRELEDIVLDVSGRDPSLGRAVVAGALFRALNIAAPHVGLAAISINGAAAENGLVVEVVEGRSLRRILPSTVHVYAAGDAARDLVAGDIGSLDVDVGDAADRADLDNVATVIAPFRNAAGFRDGAAAVMKVGLSVRYLAIDAWIANGSGYANAGRNWRVHTDSKGEASFLPDDLSTAFGADAELVATGRVVVDACRADTVCSGDLDAAIRDVNTAVVTDGAIGGLIASIRAATGGGADLDALEARIAARPAEVAARLPAP